MLTLIVQTHTARPERLAELTEAVIESEHYAVRCGYYGRRRRSVYVDPLRQRVIAMGILQHRTAAEDFATCNSSHMVSLRAALTEFGATAPITEKYDAANTHNERYCEHIRWRELVLICDPIVGLSPLRCNECGGIVAKYRLDIDPDTATRLFKWERQYDQIYSLWLQDSEYKGWAEEEIADSQSKVSRLGLEIARKMSEQLDSRVLYYLHQKHEGLDRQCPQCQQRLHESIGTIWNLSCRECLLAIGRG